MPFSGLNRISSSSMNFTSVTVNGSFRYRASQSLKYALKLLNNYADKSATETNNTDAPCEDDGSVASRLRKHPAYLSLPALSLPIQMDTAAISYLRDHSVSTPRAIEDRSVALTNYLWSRSLLSEKDILTAKLDQCREQRLDASVDPSDDPDLFEAMQYHTSAAFTERRPRALARVKENILNEWRSFTFHGHNCELYLTARLAPNFASACRVLYEIRKRCPKFIPRNLFDFGSGLGTVAWAANTVWPVGYIREHLLVEPSADMTRISEFMFRKNLTVRSPETVFQGIYHRRFLPSVKNKYNLVVAAHSLFELPGPMARKRTLANLWDRTTDFLVLIEQGTKAGFSAILEARDWLIENGGDQMHIFAPCPHHHLCGKRDSLCNLTVRYYHFGLTREKNDPQNELIAYLIVSRGDWRRHQNPVVKEDCDYRPRIVSYMTSHNKGSLHDICLPSGAVERTFFSKNDADKTLFYYLRHAKAGDMLPCEPISSSTEPDVLANSSEASSMQ